ncbi:hypothetical protein B0H17DRAFT_678231 [Mycena rosella]|uniref:Uncharacterized protein n=1 Tax=Mycena rosella TaxID=1033263 RepID=A0AAD7GH37_MYCRO|nr:hypothetical protein B0H17DRAFT_678231 [Mycena rosella]
MPRRPPTATQTTLRPTLTRRTSHTRHTRPNTARKSAQAPRSRRRGRRAPRRGRWCRRRRTPRRRRWRWMQTRRKKRICGTRKSGTMATTPAATSPNNFNFPDEDDKDEDDVDTRPRSASPNRLSQQPSSPVEQAKRRSNKKTPPPPTGSLRASPLARSPRRERTQSQPSAHADAPRQKGVPRQKGAPHHAATHLRPRASAKDSRPQRIRLRHHARLRKNPRKPQPENLPWTKLTAK